MSISRADPCGPSEREIWPSDGQNEELCADIWGSADKVVYQSYCIQAQLSMLKVFLFNRGVFFSYGTYGSGCRTPQSHWVSSVCLTALSAVCLCSSMLSICSLVVIRLCYLQNVWSHGMWMVSDQELSGSHPKISMKDRLTYFRFLVLIIHIHICFVAIKFAVKL